MRDPKAGRPIWWAATLILFLASQTHADTLPAKVIAVADGDTLTALDENHTKHTIRLSGIDAPEKRQPFGRVSRQSLIELAAGRPVVIEWAKTDRYGRKVGRVLVEGQDINLAQIQRGLAWHYKQYQREQSAADRQSYAEAEELARTAQAGLWRDPDPAPPWEFRKQYRAKTD